MEFANPFAQPSPPEVIIQQLMHQLSSDYPQISCMPELGLESLVDRSVRELWRSPVKTFVPILAQREVQDELQARGFSKRAREAAVNQSAVPPESASNHPTAADDVTSLVADDVIFVTEDDALRF